jgi:chromosome segregation protein
LAAQIDTLKKQARQAQRYRRLGDQIRRTEAQLLQVRWQDATGQAEAVAAELRGAERDLGAATETGLARERERAEAETALPPLHLAQAAAAASLQRLTHARESLEAKLGRAVAARSEAERRLTQANADLDREAERVADADAALVRLAEEQQALERAAADGEHERSRAVERGEAAARDLATAETGLQQMTEACAAGEARRAGLERQRRDLTEREARLQARLAEAEQQRQPLLAALVSAEAIADAAAAVAEAAAMIETARTAAAAAGESLGLCQQHETSAVEAARDAERVLAGLNAEAEALTRVLAPAEAEAGRGASLLAQLGVPPGFEAATAALFDGELAAPALPPPAREAAGHATGWVALPPLETAPLPPGVHALAGAIDAPQVLARRLAHAGWVDDPDDGWRLQPLLGPGQSLVDRAGRLWRWDGFTRGTAGSNATAERLRQRNRLAQLTHDIAAADAAAQRAGERQTAARAAREAAMATERAAVSGLRAAEERLSHARAGEAELVRRGMAAETRLATVADTIDKLGVDLAEIAQQTAEAGRGLALLPDPGLARAALEAARAQAAAARHRESEARALSDRLAREAEAGRRRLAAIAGEAASWQRRRDGAVAQQAQLSERATALAAEIGELAARPAAIAAESEILARSAAAAASDRQAAEDALAGAEAALRAAVDAARRADAAVGEARERRARLEAQRDAAAAALTRLRDEIAERLDVPPEEFATLLGDGSEPTAAAGDLAARLDRLLRERDGIGPVNLLAEQEAAEVEARLAGLDHERADLTAAIARLRRGIATLDQEGRKRLVAAFEELNGHFGELFQRLFGGGHAELAWAGDEDPLDAGLDILASPPGKRLGSLSLLSGGEQALTAIALIFAMFLTKPAPVCVLDEVDAPLDDANVDSFCRLVADIADTTGTRFLLITHHRVTMARMDRLFGVTMAERGVSQLVSVDLARAAELRQSA